MTDTEHQEMPDLPLASDHTADSTIAPVLRSLWRRRLETLVANLASGGREHREIAHAAQLISQDYKGRFLVELIQNANDQALRSGELESTVVVVLAQGIVVVANGGETVNETNLERLSSLADSDKNGTLVGNKGVGFKAVYEITSQPECYSSVPNDGGAHKPSVFETLGIGFALEGHPFGDAQLIDAIERNVPAFLAANPGMARSMDEHGYTDAVRAVKAETDHVAGFKFPLPRSRHDFDRRMAEVGFPDEFRAAARTIIVMPTKDASAEDAARRAVDELVQPDQHGHRAAELALLFLAGIRRLVVVDRMRSRTWEFERSPWQKLGQIQKARIRCTDTDGSQGEAAFLAVRKDALDATVQVRSRRQQIVDSANAEYRLEAWNRHDALPVTVALRVPEAREAGRGAWQPAPGRFCLGLPTLHTTGLPVHVDARFFADMARKHVPFDRQEQPYNAMLLDVAVELVDDLLAYLRASRPLALRRMATLALTRSSGELADRVYASKGIADAKVILSWDGQTFIRRSKAFRLSPAERALLPAVQDALDLSANVRAWLPDRLLLVDHGDCLDTMGLCSFAMGSHPWLRRTARSRAILEMAAASARHRGVSWWESFLTGVLDCFGSAPEKLMHLKWLPTGRDQIAAPLAKVFLPTRQPATSNRDKRLESAGEDELLSIPDEIENVLPILDHRAVRIRSDGRALTPLAARLERQRFVFHPRIADVITQAIVPELHKHAGRDDAIAQGLFALAVQLLASALDKTRDDVARTLAGTVQVPVASGESLAWMPATKAYLGTGWGLTDEDEQRLGAAYEGRRLVPLQELAVRGRADLGNQMATRRAAEALGVRGIPGFITSWPLRTGAPLASLNRTLVFQTNHRLGHPALEDDYRAYVEYLKTIGTSMQQMRDYDVADLEWIDGLDDEATRHNVVDLLLAHHKEYELRVFTTLRRVDRYGEGRRALQFWAFVLTHRGWPVFPAERGPGGPAIRTSAAELWRVSADSRNLAWTRLVPVVPQRFSGAFELLRALEVASLEQASVARLVTELGRLAERLTPEKLNRSADAVTLALRLLEHLEKRLAEAENQGQQVDAKVVRGIRLPLRRDGQIIAVDPADRDVFLVFDDEPDRLRFVAGYERAWHVPMGSGAGIARTHALLVRVYGGQRVWRSSTCEVHLGFDVVDDADQPFLAWLRAQWPHHDFAAELAALLTLDSDRQLRTGLVSDKWRLYENLHIRRGRFHDSGVVSFYDRPKNLLLVAARLSPSEIVGKTWPLAGRRDKDTWENFARRIDDGKTREFLCDRGIQDADIHDIADKAGLARTSLAALQAALLAARSKAVGCDLDDAAAWLESCADDARAAADDLGCPEHTAEIEAATRMPWPDGDLRVLELCNTSVESWQLAVLRRDGKKWRFAETEARYRKVRAWIIAIARELLVRTKNPLEEIGADLDRLERAKVPDLVAELPVTQAPIAPRAKGAVLAVLQRLPNVRTRLRKLDVPAEGFPDPSAVGGTFAGTEIFFSQPQSAREAVATSTVTAILRVAVEIAATYGERVDDAAIRAHPAIVQRTQGAWAHVRVASRLLKDLLAKDAPTTTKVLDERQAFRGEVGYDHLIAKFPDIAKAKPPRPQLLQTCVGVTMSSADLRDELRTGSDGRLGKELASAASGQNPANLLSAPRAPLPPPPNRERGGRRNRYPGEGGSGSGAGSTSVDTEFIGDLGEAFVHEWLKLRLGEDYDDGSWVSKSRSRYGYEARGSDGEGCDFRVHDPTGKVFGTGLSGLLHIEVKATTGDGDEPFPLALSEWELAKECHKLPDMGTFVILRVFQVKIRPRIGDIIVDPVAVLERQHLRIDYSELLVTVARPSAP